MLTFSKWLSLAPAGADQSNTARNLRHELIASPNCLRPTQPKQNQPRERTSYPVCTAYLVIAAFVIHGDWLSCSNLPTATRVQHSSVLKENVMGRGLAHHMLEDRPHRNHYPLLSLRTPLTSLTASRKSLTMSPKLSAPSPSEGMSHAAERHMGTKKRCNNRWVRRGGHRSVICYQRCYLGNHGMRRLGLHIFYARAWLHLPGCCLANSLDSWTKAVGCAYVHPSPAAAAGKRQTRGCCLGRVLEVKLLWKRRLPKGNHS